VTKKTLRVIHWLGAIPAKAICSNCHHEFIVPLTALKRIADAQEYLRLQFVRHTCASRS